MPRTKSNAEAPSSFAVTPWQSKRRRRDVAAEGSEVKYSEVIVPLGTEISESSTGHQIPSDEPQADSGDGGNRTGSPLVPTSETACTGMSTDYECGLFDPDLDAQYTDAVPPVVPSLSGTASVTVASQDRLIGRVLDNHGTEMLAFHTEVLMVRQECTRNDEWQLLLMHAQPAHGPRLQLLVERTGQDAVRLKSPPEPHGSEEDVDALLATKGPIHDAILTFDCQSLMAASDAQKVAAGLTISTPDSEHVINQGLLTLQPTQCMLATTA